MKEFMRLLKTRYDYIILDTPPVGLVSDAIELAEYADLTLYVMRQNYTKKDMITMLNNRLKREELDNRVADRELVQQRGANPFLTSQSTYVNDIIVRDMFLKPINTSQDKIKNSEENDS